MKAAIHCSHVQRARSLVRFHHGSSGGLFDLSRVKGRVVEVSEAGSFGALSALTGLMVQVQALGEQIAWIETGTSLFYPPDLVYRGLDVGAISVVLAPHPPGGLVAADWLLRSGAFGLVVLDWAGGGIDDSDLGRLGRLAEDKGSATVFLTRKKASDPALATLVSLRGTVDLGPEGETVWAVVKDKRSGPPSEQRSRFDGPSGLY